MAIEKRNEAGELHCVDGPALEYADGSKHWYRDGKRHRVDGPAFVGADGMREWYRNGKLHRTDGPAVEWPNGVKEWYRDGEKQRGPSVEWPNGENPREGTAQDDGGVGLGIASGIAWGVFTLMSLLAVVSMYLGVSGAGNG